MAWTIEKLANPERLRVSEGGDWKATFTRGCYTVTTAGPERTFVETFRASGQTKQVELTHSTWVRAAPGPMDAHLDERWLGLALAANDEGTPDVLAFAMQYLKQAEQDLLGDLQIAGDASYGRIVPEPGGKRQEGSDFNDYLGLRWRYPTEPSDRPEPTQKGCLDCSGYIRMIWGYRHHLPGSGYLDSVPLSLRPREGTALPRRAVEMHADAPGVILISNAGVQIKDFSRIDIGDLVFFDADPKDGDALDHVGMYFGRDVNGRYRFISSRKTPDGPTFADRGGPSLLDGKAKYARSFRAVRRL